MHVCLCQPELFFFLLFEMLMSFPVVIVLYLCFCFVSKFARVHLPEFSVPGQAAEPGPMLHIQFRDFYVKYSYESQSVVFM